MSLRFQTKRYAPAFKDALGLSPTGTAIAIDICSSPGSPTSYSRTRGHYLKPNRYRNPLYTLDKVIGSVDRLDAFGLIDHDKRAPGVRGWQSTLSPKSDLIGITRRILGDDPLVILPPKELVLLKDGRGDLIDYRDTRVQERQRKNLRTYNEALSAAQLPPQIAAPVVRIYNEDFGRNGRFYAMGDSWQNLKRAARLDLQIAGEPVVELDFKTLHPAMLYADAGTAIPEDCYDIPPWERGLAKVGLLTIINAPTEARARGSLAHKQFSHLPEQEAMREADRLISAIKAKHRPIAHTFHSDAGAALMRRDSDLAERVIMRMLSKGVTVLPVHDSFLVQQSKADLLLATMMEVAQAAGLTAVQVERKLPA